MIGARTSPPQRFGIGSTTALSIAALSSALVCAGVQADVVIDLAYIGNPGNAADVTGRGSVVYPYYMGTYEITVAQYTEFLNNSAQSDPYGLYSGSMASSPYGAFITQSGTDGSYTYSAVSGKEDQPVRWVSLYDGMRFCNWLANGQGSGDTETGVYDMSQGDETFRSTNATWVVPTLDEWYKAAYYSPLGVYYDYPDGTDDVPTEPTDETTPRTFNFGGTPFWQGTVVLTSIGETTGQSAYGAFDQGGNVEEWTETSEVPQWRVLKGGHAWSAESPLSANSLGSGATPGTEGEGFGFRVACLIPEPGTVGLVGFGFGVLALRGGIVWRRRYRLQGRVRRAM
jgi:formylglycine-generating enzyme